MPVRNLRLARHLADTASSARHSGRLPGGSSTVTSRAPNVTYSQGDGGSPSMIHITGAAMATVSPRYIGCAATCATCRTKCRDSDLRHGPCRGRNTPAYARWWRPPRPKPDPCVVKWRAALPHWTAAADANAARTAEEITSHVQEVAEYSNAQASRVTADVTQRLEKEIVAAATSTTAMAEVTTHAQ